MHQSLYSIITHMCIEHGEERQQPKRTRTAILASSVTYPKLGPYVLPAMCTCPASGPGPIGPVTVPLVP